MAAEALFLGIDIGTSGCRAIAIDKQGEIYGKAFVAIPIPQREGNRVEQDPAIWWQGVQQVLSELGQLLPLNSVEAISLDGTSSTVVAIDEQGKPLHPGLMYNDSRSVEQAAQIAEHAPQESAAHGASSTLAKTLWLQTHLDKSIHRFSNQSDWIVGQLSGHFDLSDYNNCIKLGFDATNREWPMWIEQLGISVEQLPKVFAPGTPITHIRDDIADQFGFTRNTPIIAGTTDSTAAIYATGAMQPGEAITSLGSTLVTKVISEKPIFLPSAGVYSQPFGEHWLVGGGSNSGGNVLLHFFSPQEMNAMTEKLTPEQSTSLDYYPLISPGERFPINDPQLAARLTPRPSDNTVFFQGMLEGIANIEKQAYDLLHSLGAPYPTCVYSAGGGANNKAWTRIRGNILNVDMRQPAQQDAAYGVAIIARNGA